MLQKRWPVENFRAIAAELSKRGIQFVIVGGPEDRGVASTVVSAGRGLSLAGELSLLESAAVIDHAKVLLSNDSGLLHMAVGLNTPALGLFGPSDSNKWGPRQSGGGSLQSEVDCSPCSKYGMIPDCSHALYCMGKIEPDRVMSELMALWAKSNNSAGDF
jgi:ADP-heptose:LPS heptosyltransferase